MKNTEIVLSEIYKIISYNVFDGRLPVCDFQVVDTTRAKSGWSYKIKNSHYFITISFQHLGDENSVILLNMMHQIIHVFLSSKGVDGTCNHGAYHNKLFREVAEQHGVICSFEHGIGYQTIEITDELIRKINIPDLRKRLNDGMEKDINAMPERKSRTKFICPECRRMATAGKTMKLYCGWCMIEMEKKTTKDK